MTTPIPSDIPFHAAMLRRVRAMPGHQATADATEAAGTVALLALAHAIKAAGVEPASPVEDEAIGMMTLLIVVSTLLAGQLRPRPETAEEQQAGLALVSRISRHAAELLVFGPARSDAERRVIAGAAAEFAPQVLSAAASRSAVQRVIDALYAFVYQGEVEALARLGGLLPSEA